MLRYIRDVVPAYFAQPRKVYNSGGQIRATRILIYRPSSPDSTDLYISTLVQDLQREAPRFTGLPPPTITSQLGNSLSGLPEQQGQEMTFLWTGERVGLAYDAARLFFQAELNYEGSNNKPV